MSVRRVVRLRALSEKQFGGLKRRPLRAPTPCYTRWADRRQEFVLGGKPDALKAVGSIHQKVWDQYQNHLERATPLDRARYYARQMEARHLRSTAALERLLGLPSLRAWRALRLLQLPEPIQQFLDEHRTPAVVRYFTERKLLEILKLGDVRRMGRRFQIRQDEPRTKGASPDQYPFRRTPLV
jgi:hypothetical protein